MDIQPSSNAGTRPAPTAQPSATTSPISSDFEDFIKLLTAQAKYQDPLQPLDSTEYVAQLAQFSAVEQQVLTNKLIEVQNGLTATSAMASLSGWVGMEARAAAPAQFDGSAITVHTPPTGSEQASLVVRNAAGTEVDRIPISTNGGPVVWQGRNVNGTAYPSGLYGFQVETRTGGEVDGITTAEVYSRVTEARIADGQAVLVLQGGVEVPSDSVTAIRQ